MDAKATAGSIAGFLTYFERSVFLIRVDRKIISTKLSTVLKLIGKIKNNPKNVRFNDIKKVLLAKSFIIRQPSGGSSHYVFSKPGKMPITIPKKRPFIKEHYVRQVLKLIED